MVVSPPRLSRSRRSAGLLRGPSLRHAALALLLALGAAGGTLHAYQGMPTPRLHVAGRYLDDPNGRHVTLHGYMQPGETWFNGEGHNFLNPSDFTRASSVAPALKFYEAVADVFAKTGPQYGASHGRYASFVRYLADGGGASNFAAGWNAAGQLASPAQFKGWIANILVPYVAHCRAAGLYVVLCGNPSVAYPGADPMKNMTKQYQQNLITFWKTVAAHPKIKGADNVLFEICNEPILIETTFGAGNWGSGDATHWKAHTAFLQPVVDAIRAQGADNIILLPGLGWQGEYQGFATYPLTGGNLGYAAHLYPAYGDVHDSAAELKALWRSNYQPAANRLPMVITEMFWDPNDGTGYQDLWNATTAGFGRNVKALLDAQGNVSYLIGMVGDHLANLKSGLAGSTLAKAQGAQAAFAWWPAYRTAAPTKPAGGPAARVYELSPADAATLAVAVDRGSRTVGARITQTTWRNSMAQRFRFHALGNNRFWLEPLHAPGKCIEVIKASPANGAGLQLAVYRGTLGQQWHVIPAGSGTFRLLPAVNPSRGLDQPKSATTSGLALQIYDYKGSANQRWKLTPR